MTLKQKTPSETSSYFSAVPFYALGNPKKDDQLNVLWDKKNKIFSGGTCLSINGNSYASKEASIYGPTVGTSNFGVSVCYQNDYQWTNLIPFSAYSVSY
jgi:hypothetical protein